VALNRELTYTFLLKSKSKMNQILSNITNDVTDNTVIAVVNNVVRKQPNQDAVNTEMIRTACEIVELFFSDPNAVLERLQTDPKVYKAKLVNLYAEKEGKQVA